MSAVIRLWIDREELRGELARFRRVSWQATMAISPGEPWIPKVSELLKPSPLKRGMQVDVLLNRPPLQRRLVEDLPPVSSRALGRMVAFQRSRIFREGDQCLITDAKWLRGGTGRINPAACVALDERIAEELAEEIKAAGFRLRMLSVGGDWARYGLDLRSATMRLAQQRVQRAATVRVAAALGVLWILAGALTIGRLVRDNRRVTQALARLEEPRTAVLAARRTLEHAAGMIRMIDDAQRTRWALADQVSWLSSTLPDSAFLTELDLSANGAGSATGWARRPLEVQPALERASGDRVSFSQTSNRQSTESMTWEGFSLQLRRVR